MLHYTTSLVLCFMSVVQARDVCTSYSETLPWENGQNSSNVGLFLIIFEAYSTDNTAKFGLCGNIDWAEFSQHSHTILRTTSRSYTVRKLRKFRFRSILIIFESCATDSTTELCLSGRFTLNRVSATSQRYCFDLRTTLESYTLRKLWKF